MVCTLFTVHQVVSGRRGATEGPAKLLLHIISTNDEMTYVMMRRSSSTLWGEYFLVCGCKVGGFNFGPPNTRRDGMLKHGEEGRVMGRTVDR